jgi:hypothetical protein
MGVSLALPFEAGRVSSHRSADESEDSAVNPAFGGCAAADFPRETAELFKRGPSVGEWSRARRVRTEVPVNAAVSALEAARR